MMILPDGVTLRIRPLAPGDLDRLTAFFYSLSPESVYRRFLAPIHEVGPEQVRRYVDFDHTREQALAAVVGAEDGERIVGVVRFHISEHDSAEVAVVVADSWQRRGVGRVLMAAAHDAARAMGITRFVGTIDASNIGLVRFAEACGFGCIFRYEDGVLKMQFDL